MNEKREMNERVRRRLTCRGEKERREAPVKMWWLIGLIALAVPMNAAEPPGEETNRIRQTVLDYVSSRYEGRPDLMRTVLHPDGVRSVVGANVEGTTFVIHEGFEKIVAGARQPYGLEKEQLPEIQILDVTGRAATVKLTSLGVVHLHLVKTRERIEPNQEAEVDLSRSQPSIVTDSWRILHILEIVSPDH